MKVLEKRKMLYSLVLHELAEDELWTAIDWYDSQKNKLGREFAKELQKVMQTIRQHPSRFPKANKKLRKAVLRKFPYICSKYYL